MSEEAVDDRFPPAAAGGALLRGHARDLYDDLRLLPLLRRLMLTSCQLADAAGGSISIVDSVREHYIKIAERGTSCRLGQTFPLAEGVTGRVMLNRRPVVLARYRDLETGHLPAGHPAREGSVAAIPIWWRGDVIGVNVIFAGRPHRFTTAMIDQLEALTQLAAPGLVTASAGHPDVSHLTNPPALAGERDRDPTGGTALDRGLGNPAPSSVTQLSLDLVALAQRAALSPPSGAALRIAVLQGDRSFRMLVRSDVADQPEGALSVATEPDVWWELVDAPTSAVGVERQPLVLPLGSGEAAAGRPSGGPTTRGQPSPLTAREREVAALLARGLSDRAVAHRLVISPKTVEKHVAALLRKTGTSSRTAAVVQAMERGWLTGE